MFEKEVLAALSDLPLGGIRFYSKTSSTNDEAIAWLRQGAADLSLVVADEQTAGRGRSGRTWETPAGTALALSVILKNPVSTDQTTGRLAGLGALAVVNACTPLGIHAEIKWPNDVLVGGRKIAGILVESEWLGEALEGSILGIGVNVLAGSTRDKNMFSFPATNLEDELGLAPNRFDFLRGLMWSLVNWLKELNGGQIIKEWDRHLAFRGQQIVLTQETQTPITGILLGLEADGSLLIDNNSQIVRVHIGEIHLRPTNDRIS